MSDEIKVSVTSYGSGRALSLYWRDPTTGKRKVVSAKTTDEGKAERAAAVLQDELNNGRYQAPSKVTWEQFVERYKGEKLAALAPATKKAALLALRHLEKVINPDKLVKLTPAVMSRFQSSLRNNAGMKDTTIAKTLRHIRAALAWGVSIGLLPKVPELHSPKRTKGQAMMKGRPITGEEFDRMLAAIPTGLIEVSQRQRVKEPKRPVKVKTMVITKAIDSSWRHYLTGLWLSGLRLEESLILSWDEEAPFSIDLSGRRPAFRILAEAQKAGRDEVLPMTPDFAEFILTTSEAQRVGQVFRPLARTEGEPMGPAKASVVVAAIGKAAKVVTNKAEGKFATAHDLRRSFGTRWAKRVMPAVLQRLMRHSAIQTTMGFYVDLNAAEVADELWAKFGATEGAKPGHLQQPVQHLPENENRPGNAEPVKSYLAKD